MTTNTNRRRDKTRNATFVFFHINIIDDENLYRAHSCVINITIYEKKTDKKVKSLEIIGVREKKIIIIRNANLKT